MIREPTKEASTFSLVSHGHSGYKTRSCLDLKKQKERRKEEKKKKNGSYHFEFSTQNEKLVAHASALRRTSVCDKLTKKKIH